MERSIQLKTQLMQLLKESPKKNSGRVAGIRTLHSQSVPVHRFVQLSLLQFTRET